VAPAHPESRARLHYQFKAPQACWRSLAFLDKIVSKDSHPELKSAVATLLAKESQIFAYRAVWAEHPELAGVKATRANGEGVNRCINLLDRLQYGLRPTKHARMRLEGRLKCPFIVSELLLEHEARNL